MAAVTIASLVSFFADEPKSIKRGENHYKSEHVLSFLYFAGVIKGTVHASMKDKAYKASVYLNEDGITSCECECPRGSYKCSHAAALLIHAIHNLSRTDVECAWKRQKSTNTVKSVQEIYPPPPAMEGYKPLGREIMDDDRQWFYEELKKYGKFTGMAWILSPEPQKKNLPVPTIEEIVSSREFVETEAEQESYLLEKLKVSEEDIKVVHVLTIGQRDNPSWLKLRKGRLTASNFGAVLNSKRVTPSLIKRVLGEYSLSGVQAINWGINNEAEAIKAFVQATGLTVEDSGLWLDPSGILGASPDGLIGTNCVLEVKCPFTQRHSKMAEAVKSKDFYLEQNERGYSLKKTHIYWHQVQGQLFITQREICFFVVWTLKETLVLQINKDEQWGENLDTLKTFFKEHMLKKILEV